MKLKAITITALILSLALCTAVYGEEISVCVDGQLIEFAAAPYIENDRTMVPMRRIFEELGAVVEWDDAEQSVTASAGGSVAALTIGLDTMYVNGSAVPLDAVPTLIDDTTFVPLRAVSEALGCTVEWNDGESRVYITRGGEATYSGYSGVPNFGTLMNIAPVSVLEDGTVYSYENVPPEDAEEYKKIMTDAGFTSVDAVEYTIYTKGSVSVLAGYFGGLFRIVLCNY